MKGTYVKRRLALLLAATSAVATVGMFNPAPVGATDVCTGHGTMTLSAGLGLPTTTTATAAFSLGFTAGGCAVTPGFAAAGVLTGSCGHFTGEGVHGPDSEPFYLVAVGSVIVFTGELTGTLTTVEDPTDSGSCTNGTAVKFLSTGALVMFRKCPPGFDLITYKTTVNGGTIMVRKCIPNM